VPHAYSFGVARTTHPRSPELLAELCELMSMACDAEITPRLPHTYRLLADEVALGKTAIAWMPPIPCVELEEKGLAEAITLPVRDGLTAYFSALLARRDGPRTLAEVKAKRVGWVDRDSSSGYLVPRLHLIGSGRSPKEMFAEERMLGSHAAVLDAVEAGECDVGATHCATKTPRWGEPGGPRERPFDALTVVGPIPNDAVVVSSVLPAALREIVQRFFLDLEERAKAVSRDLFSADDFRVASPTHFAPLRRILAAAKSYGG
jgi:phosphonate transport system substrate-binding protein